MPGFDHWRTSLDFALMRYSNLSILKEKFPLYLQTDKGTDLKNALFQGQLAEYKIKFYTSENDDIKAALERFNRTLKTCMYRYFTHSISYRYVGVLQDLVHSFNHTHFSNIGIAPASVNVKNACLVRQQLFHKHPENQNGDSTSVNEWESLSKSKHWRKATYPDGRRNFEHWQDISDYSDQLRYQRRDGWRDKRPVLRARASVDHQGEQRVWRRESVKDEKAQRKNRILLKVERLPWQV